jgi:hypothetical protein
LGGGEKELMTAGRQAERLRRQASLQKRTCGQSLSHFLRQVNGRPQAAQSLVGKCCFLTPRMMRKNYPLVTSFVQGRPC